MIKNLVFIVTALIYIFLILRIYVEFFYQPPIKVKVLKTGCLPTRTYPNDAGLDLKCAEAFNILPGQTLRVPTGLAVAVPKRYVGDISPRSSGSSNGITVQGKVDFGYTGEIQAIVTNCSNKAIHFKAGERIAQLVVMRITTRTVFVDKLPESERGSKGFGSSGR